MRLRDITAAAAAAVLELAAALALELPVFGLVRVAAATDRAAALLRDFLAPAVVVDKNAMPSESESSLDES